MSIISSMDKPTSVKASLKSLRNQNEANNFYTLSLKKKRPQKNIHKGFYQKNVCASKEETQV